MAVATWSPNTAQRIFLEFSIPHLTKTTVLHVLFFSNVALTLLPILPSPVLCRWLALWTSLRKSKQSEAVFTFSCPQSTIFPIAVAFLLKLKRKKKYSYSLKNCKHFIFKTDNQQSYCLAQGDAAWMGGESRGEWMHVYVWLHPYAVQMKPSQRC